MGRLVARGKYLFDGERKFYARGVSYGPFPPNSRGERYPEPERVTADFALMIRASRLRNESNDSRPSKLFLAQFVRRIETQARTVGSASGIRVFPMSTNLN